MVTFKLKLCIFKGTFFMKKKLIKLEISLALTDLTLLLLSNKKKTFLSQNPIAR